ncbi:MAG: cupin domain-containing protein [Proteobacteria bacterium]|nr:cupin domain-containing protein [Pseudomonadota bacterium]MBI3497738.1 cupin domain-containing protein [Pseudomonadota bacterium]
MPAKPERPAFIRHYREIERSYGADDLEFAGAPFGKTLGLARIGVNHDVIPPGHRTSFPHAHSEQEEFVFVIEGHPDVWIDGVLHALGPGDGIAFPSGTGIAHSVLNNSDAPVRLLVVGERRSGDRIAFPINPERRDRPNYWHDAPTRPLGAHDGRVTARVR